MAWLRVGDNVTTHPFMSKLLAATGLQHPQKNEAFGVLIQLAAVTAGHLTDCVVEFGLLAQVAPGREREILETLKKAGLAKEDTLDDHLVIRLVLDDEEFIHARTRKEVETDRRRARDKRTPGLLARVRMRDGDRCRWCGKSVSWTNRSGHRSATYDSLTEHKDSTVDTLVISCGRCNSRRGGGETLSLLNPPTRDQVLYGKETVNFVNSDKWCQDHGIRIETSQMEIPLDGTSAAADRQQQEVQAAAPEEVAAPDHRAAPPAAPVTDAEEPDWLTQPISSITRKTARSAEHETAAADRQQQGVQAAAPEEVVAPDHRAAPPTAPDGSTAPEDNSLINDPGRDLGRRRDGPGNVGSGRVGSGSAGTGSAGTARKRRRRGKRGGRNK